MFQKIKYKILTSFFKNRKKLLWTLSNHLISKSLFPPTVSVINLSKETYYGNKNERIFLRNDSYLAWYVFNNTNIYQEIVKKISSFLKNDQNYNLIDIGANIGLLARTLIRHNKNIKKCYVVEPDEDNFFCIKNNLKNFNNTYLSNFALDIENGNKKLFIDQNNKANLSFNFEMMKKKEDKLNFMNLEENYKVVKCKSVEDYFSEIDSNNKNIIKIDAQGYDEKIFQEIPKKVLDNTSLLMIEITPLETKSFNKEKFNEKLKCFKKYYNFDNKELNIDEVNTLINLKSGKHFDLIFVN
mgnify:CR=1 FL=1|tara:strand:- start:232 stop:1125 length:894 start_codon:yes stop_codon:yes gene_type:complete